MQKIGGNIVSVNQIPAIIVPSGRTGHLIAALGAYLLQGQLLYCLDGGNVFDPYRLASCARREGVDPNRILNQVFVSRAYTCHQLLEAAKVMLPPLLDQRPEPIVALLGLDRLFHDENINLEERRYIFDQLLAWAAQLHKAGLPLLITLTSIEPNPWKGRVARIARILPGSREALPLLQKGIINGTHTAHI